MNAVLEGALRASRRCRQKLAVSVLGLRRSWPNHSDGRAATAGAEYPIRTDLQGQPASDLIRALLERAEPCMIARIGHTEMKAMLRHRAQQACSPVKNAWRFINQKQDTYWWDAVIRWELRYSSGFFPANEDAMKRFAELYLAELSYVDVLGVWLPEEDELRDRFPNARKVPLQDLEPFFHADPWTTALEGRTVLAIHPFAVTIERQFAKREVLFSDDRLLPRCTLKTLKAVQSLGDNTEGHATWFDALRSMRDSIADVDFDVAIIGAGAYGLPLAAHVKRMGKKAIHLGGASQLLFGIRGKRWEERPEYQPLFNEHWVRPLGEETPNGHHYVDQGVAYW